jgi:hypothetical protein
MSLRIVEVHTEGEANWAARVQITFISTSIASQDDLLRLAQFARELQQKFSPVNITLEQAK